MKCRAPRRPLDGSIQLEQLSKGALRARGVCETCSTKMHKSVKVQDASALYDQPSLVPTTNRFNDSHITPISPETSSDNVGVQKRGRATDSPKNAVLFNASNERLKLRFLEFEREALGKSDKTIRLYETALLRFEQFFKYRKLGPLSQQEAIAFKNHLRQGPLTIPVVKATLKVVQSFHQWQIVHSERRSRGTPVALDYLNLTQKERRQAVPMENIRRAPTLEDINKAILMMPARTLVEQRNRAVFALVALTAVRAGVLATLRRKHLDLAEGILTLQSSEVETKFSKSARVVLVPFAYPWLNMLSLYVDALRAAGFDDQAPLFPKTEITQGRGVEFAKRTLSKEPFVDRQVFDRCVIQACLTAGLPPFTIHSIRRTHVRLSCSAGIDVGLAIAISQNLGHSHPRTTFSSYGTLTLDDRKQIICQKMSNLSSDTQSERHILSEIKNILSKF